jgi:hypothetical protein
MRNVTTAVANSIRAVLESNDQRSARVERVVMIRNGKLIEVPARRGRSRKGHKRR